METWTDDGRFGDESTLGFTQVTELCRDMTGHMYPHSEGQIVVGRPSNSKVAPRSMLMYVYVIQYSEIYTSVPIKNVYEYTLNK